MTARPTSQTKAPLIRSARPLVTLLRVFDELARTGQPVTLSRLRQRFKASYKPAHYVENPTDEHRGEAIKKGLRRGLDKAAAEGRLTFRELDDDWIVKRPGPAPRLKSRRGCPPRHG